MQEVVELQDVERKRKGMTMDLERDAERDVLREYREYREGLDESIRVMLHAAIDGTPQEYVDAINKVKSVLVGLDAAVAALAQAKGAVTVEPLSDHPCPDCGRSRRPVWIFGRILRWHCDHCWLLQPRVWTRRELDALRDARIRELEEELAASRTP